MIVLNKGEASGIVPNPCSFSHQLVSKLIAILRGESLTGCSLNIYPILLSLLSSLPPSLPPSLLPFSHRLSPTLPCAR